MQSRGMSAVEAFCNVLLGLAVAFVTQLVAFPMVGLEATLNQHLMLNASFTLVSLLRSYVLRRGFASLERASVASAASSAPAGGGEGQTLAHSSRDRRGQQNISTAIIPTGGRIE